MEELPKLGNWYETDEGETFVILATDSRTGAVDVRFLDGRVDQFSGEMWRGLELLEIEPPEEWRDSMDEFFRERGRGK